MSLSPRHVEEEKEKEWVWQQEGAGRLGEGEAWLPA